MVFPRHAFINNDTKEFGIVYTDYILTIDGNFAIFMINFITWNRHNSGRYTALKVLFELQLFSCISVDILPD